MTQFQSDPKELKQCSKTKKDTDEVLSNPESLN